MIYIILHTTSKHDIRKTVLVPNDSPIKLPINGPIVNDNPNVARANPYAGARFSGMTQSDMQAKVREKVAEKMPDKLNTIVYIIIFDVNDMTITGKVLPIMVINKQVFLPILSDILPKRGQLINARSPLIVSDNPTTK